MEPINVAAALAERVGGLSPLPPIVGELLSITSRSDSSAQEVFDLVRNDMALGSKILRLANSSAYGGRSEPILEMRHAITYLGFRKVVDLALASSVSCVFESDEVLGDYSRAGLWQHSVGVAVLSEWIARRMGREIPGVFACGLLHDVGLALADQYVHSEFASVVSEAAASVPLHERELDAFGFDHGELGAETATLWRLPQPFSVVMRYHHAPWNAPKPDVPLVCVVYLADRVCYFKRFGSVLYGVADAIGLEFAMGALDMVMDDMQAILSDVAEELERARPFVELLSGAHESA